MYWAFYILQLLQFLIYFFDICYQIPTEVCVCVCIYIETVLELTNFVTFHALVSYSELKFLLIIN